MITTCQQMGLGRHILVTGGAGYLGGILVPALLTEGYSVTVLDRFIFGNDALAPVADHQALRIIRDDVSNADRIAGELLRGVDAVIHMASISNDPTCDLDPNQSIATNYLATTALARLARAERVQQFIFISTCSVYGGSGSRVLDEHSATGPITLYALTKLASERDLLDLSSHDFRVTILRLATLFGLAPRMRFDLAVNAMAKRAIQGKSVIVNGDGKQYRPFVHVRDASEAIRAVLRADPTAVRHHIFNIGADGLNYTIRQLAEEVGATTPGAIVEHVPSNNDARSYRVRFQKVTESLGWVSRYSIRDAVEEIRTAALASKLGTMDEERYYNMLVMKKLHGAGVQNRWSAASSPVPFPENEPRGSATADSSGGAHS